jgi:choline dehydrogenase-like flavoprotein
MRLSLLERDPGGCVLGNRILANTEYEVVLLERGPDTPTEVATDLSCFPAGLNQNAEWNSSEPQTGLSNRLAWCHTVLRQGSAVEAS